jgi:microcystin-dependent protein
MKEKYPLLPTLGLALLFFLTAPAQSVPPLINYQGRLTDQTGAPLGGGLYTIQFRLWNDPTATASANLIWSQQQSVAVQTNGTFDVLLGSTNGSTISGDNAAFANIASSFGSSNVFLGVTVTVSNGVSISSPSQILPRQQLLSVPFAVQAQQAQLAQQAQVASSLVSSQAYALCPTGTVVAFMGGNAPPGWLLCDGSLVSRTTYANLFAVIGTSIGSGDGSTTFNLPDMRGVFLRGMNGSRSDSFADPDDNATLRVNAFSGGNTGNALGSYQLDQFASHTHGYQYEPNVNGFSGEGTSAPRSPYGTAQTSAAGGNETRPKNVYVNYIIKY